MTTTNPSASYFEKVADQWDDLRSGYFTEGLRKAAIRKAYLHPDMHVADVGSGTGFIALGLAPLVKQVTVLDGSPAMLEVARKNLAAFTNVTFHQADGLALPLPDSSQDAVFANMYLHHCPDPLAAIREMTRLLKPGGRLVITDADTHTHEWMRTEMSDLWLGFERDQVRSWFEQAGLVNIILDCTGETCQAGCQSGEGEKADVSIFLAAGTRRIPAREAVEASYSAQALGQGCGCSSTQADCCSPQGKPAAQECCTPASQSTGQECCSPQASQAGKDCCSSALIPLETIVSDIVDDNGYSAAEKATVPQEAAGFSLGCGNPTAMAGLRPGEVVLDIGSGGGLDSFLAARQVGPTGSAIGVDMTPAMLERARAAANKAGYTNVEFKQGFAEKLPVTDGTVDVILSNCVINLTEDKGVVFREAFRALKVGGRLEVSDIVFGGAVPPALHDTLMGWSECVTGALPEEEYIDLVKQAGFTEVAVRRSAPAGTGADQVYSLQLSAKKPV